MFINNSVINMIVWGRWCLEKDSENDDAHGRLIGCRIAQRWSLCNTVSLLLWFSLNLDRKLNGSVRYPNVRLRVISQAHWHALFGTSASRPLTYFFFFGFRINTLSLKSRMISFSRWWRFDATTIVDNGCSKASTLDTHAYPILQRGLRLQVIGEITD